MKNSKAQTPYAQIPKSVFYNKNLTLTQKGVYIHMYDRYRFCKSKSNDFFDTLELMAETLNISRTVLQQSISALEGEGLIIKSKKKLGKFASNVYKVLECPMKPDYVTPKGVIPTEELDEESTPF